MRRSFKVLLRLLPVSLSGVVLGHFLVYKWLFPPSSHVHDGTSDQHKYLPVFIALSTMATLLSLAWYIYAGYKEHSNKELQLQPKFSYLHTTIILFVAQSVTFVIMEILEQGHSINVHTAVEFFRSQLFVVGVLLQLFTAALVALSVYTATAIGRYVGTNKRAICLPQALMRTSNAHIAWVLNERITNRGPPTTFSIISNY